MRRSLIALLAVSLTTPCFGADPEVQGSALPAALAEGARVRLDISDTDEFRKLPNRFEGRVASVDPESITLRLSASREVTVPRRAIERVRVPAGRSRLRGVLIGAGVGTLVVGGLSGIALATCDPKDWCLGPLAGLYYFTPLAAVAGGAIGALSPPEEVWKTMPRERLRVTARPILGKEGVGVRVALSF